MSNTGQPSMHRSNCLSQPLNRSRNVKLSLLQVRISDAYGLGMMRAPFTIITTSAATVPAIGSVRTQVRKIFENKTQDTFPVPLKLDTSPTPITPPTWQCVVDTGNSITVAIMVASVE